MSNEILVAGMDVAENPFTKMVLEYGFKPVHVPRESIQNLPNCRAAIVITTNCSHALMERVKKEYIARNRPVIYAKHGSSAIKDEFEKLIVDPVKNLIDPLNKKYQVLFLIAYFYPVGTRIYTGDVSELVSKYGVELAQNYISVIFSDLFDDGTLEKMVGTGSKGRYIFKGVTEIDSITLNKKTLFNIPPAWKQGTKVLVEPVPQAVPVAEEVKKDLPAAQVSADFEKRIEERFEQFTNIITTKLITITKSVDVMQHSFNPNTRESMIREITDRLDKMSASDLLKFRTFLAIWEK
jgi:hypothetical protein